MAIPGSDGNSLCYEVHGEAGRYFNLISDTCVSANAYYTAMPSDVQRNRISKIGVKASSGGPEGCVEVEVDLELCVARVGGREVDGSVTISQVRVSRVMINLWRVAVPNCQRPGLVMWVTCMSNRLRFDVNRGSSLRPSSHGLLGESHYITIILFIVPPTHSQLRLDHSSPYLLQLTMHFTHSFPKLAKLVICLHQCTTHSLSTHQLSYSHHPFIQS